MTRPFLTLTLTLATAAAASAGDADARRTPLLRPALYVVGALDDSGDVPGALNQELLGPPRSLSLGGALDALWEGRASRFQGSLFGIVHSPYSDSERGLLLAGRVHAMRVLGSTTRVTFDDSARLQRGSGAGLIDYARNEAVLGIEWQRARGPAWTLRVADRHRKVTELSRLCFCREAASLGAAFTLSPRLLLAAEVSAHRYSTETVRGESGAVTLSLAHVSLRRTVALRGAWFVPVHDRPTRQLAAAASFNNAADPANEATLVRDAPVLSPAPLPPSGTGQPPTDTPLEGAPSMAGNSSLESSADPFLFDPLESDTDEWSFGRHKQVVALLLSQRLAERTRVALLTRYQHSSGPNLLTAYATGPDTVENRVWWRLTLRHQVWRQTVVFLHGGYLLNRSTDDSQDFSRALVVGGIEIPF